MGGFGRYNSCYFFFVCRQFPKTHETHCHHFSFFSTNEDTSPKQKPLRRRSSSARAQGGGTIIVTSKNVTEIVFV